MENQTRHYHRSRTSVVLVNAFEAPLALYKPNVVCITEFAPKHCSVIKFKNQSYKWMVTINVLLYIVQEERG